MIHPEEIGMDLDIARVLDYRQATARLNRYAADGWRVRGFGMFEYAVVLLERDVDPPAE